MSTGIRVVVVDDHLVVREGLRLILESEEGFQAVGEAADGGQALPLIERLVPDVVLLDLRMPGTDGLAVLEALRLRGVPSAVVVLTTFNEDELMARALRAGARGYLLKDTSRQVLLDTVRAAARGELLLRPEQLARVFARADEPARVRANGVVLSEREREVLAAVAAGERNREIADRLGLSERTVKAHLTSVFNKLGVDTRAAAVSAGIRQGLIDAES